MLSKVHLLFLIWRDLSGRLPSWLEASMPISATSTTFSNSYWTIRSIDVAPHDLMMRAWLRHLWLLVVPINVVFKEHHLPSSATSLLIIVNAWVQRWSHFHLGLRLSRYLSPRASLLLPRRLICMFLLRLLLHNISKSIWGATSVCEPRRLGVIIFKPLHLLLQVVDGHHGNELLVLLHNHHLMITLLAGSRLVAILGFIATFVQLVIAG